MLLSQSHPLRDRQQLRTLLVFAGTQPDSTWHQVTQSRLSWHHLLRPEGACSLGEGNCRAQGHAGSGSPTGQGLTRPPTASFCGGAGWGAVVFFLLGSAGKSQPRLWFLFLRAETKEHCVTPPPATWPLGQGRVPNL